MNEIDPERPLEPTIKLHCAPNHTPRTVRICPKTVAGTPRKTHRLHSKFRIVGSYCPCLSLLVGCTCATRRSMWGAPFAFLMMPSMTICASNTSSRGIDNPWRGHVQFQDRFKLITVCLKMIEFNLILKVAGEQIGAGMFWRLLVDTVIMHACG